MSSVPIIETGLQLVTRLIDRPSIEGLDKDLFFNNLDNTDIIEIRGTVSSGTSMLLTKLIAKCILPLNYNGINVNVLMINTENQFKMSKLINIIHKEVSDIQGPVNVDGTVKEILNNLKIINCYNHYEFLMTLKSLDDIFLKNKKIGLLVIDSISAYYWQQKHDPTCDLSFTKLLKLVKQVTFEFKVLFLYTKQFHFESKNESIDRFDGKKLIRYQIRLTHNDNTNERICIVKSENKNKQLHYEIEETGFVWKVPVDK